MVVVVVVVVVVQVAADLSTGGEGRGSIIILAYRTLVFVVSSIKLTNSFTIKIF